MLSQIATVYVEPANSLPVAQGTYQQTVFTTNPTSTPKFSDTLSFSDDPGDDDTVSIVSGSETNIHVYGFDPMTGHVDYEPATDPGTGQFQFQVTDQYGAESAVQTFTEYTSIPDAPPIARDDVVVLPRDLLDDRGVPIHVPQDLLGPDEHDSFPPAQSVLANDTSFQGNPLTGVAEDGSPLPSAWLVQPPLYAAPSAVIAGTVYSPGFKLNPDGTFIYVPGPNFKGTDYFTYVANDGYQDSGVPETGPLLPGETPFERQFKNVATVTIVSDQFNPSTPPRYGQIDTDGDGQSDYAEAWGNFPVVLPPGETLGDANGDGIPDFLEPNITTLATDNNGILALESPLGTAISHLGSIDTYPVEPPPGVDLPFGTITFEVSSDPPKSALPSPVEVDKVPEQPLNPVPDAYYEFDSIPNFTWSSFDLEALDPSSGNWVSLPPNVSPDDVLIKTGSIVSSTKIELFIMDSRSLGDDGRGDQDFSPKVIRDPGGPAYYVAVPALAGPTTGVREQPLQFTLSAADLSKTKLAAGFTYTINWGDGSPAETIARTPGDGAGVPLEHVFSQVRSYAVKVTATDEYGMAGAPLTVPVAIHDVALEKDPLLPRRKVLAVGGTAGRDVVRIVRGKGGRLRVTLDGLRLGSYDSPGRIAVYGGPGNDDIRLGPCVRQPAWLAGGTGNNVLVGGAGPDVLTVGRGRSVLFGRRGRNVIVTDSGGNRVIRRHGRDLVLRDPTLTLDEQTLEAVALQWLSRRRPTVGRRHSHLPRLGSRDQRTNGT
jgi:hypothetical protein